MKLTPLPEYQYKPIGSKQVVPIFATDHATDYRSRYRFVVATLGGELVTEIEVRAYSSEQAGIEAAKYVNEELRRGRIGGPSLSTRLKEDGFSVADVMVLRTLVSA